MKGHLKLHFLKLRLATLCLTGGAGNFFSNCISSMFAGKVRCHIGCWNLLLYSLNRLLLLLLLLLLFAWTTTSNFTLPKKTDELSSLPATQGISSEWSCRVEVHPYMFPSERYHHCISSSNISAPNWANGKWYEAVWVFLSLPKCPTSPHMGGGAWEELERV